MTNEQREAIEYLKESVLIYKNTIPKISEAIETVLSMLKEKNEQIVKYEKIYKEYDCYRWVKELDKKDRQIDLMAEYIANRDNDEDICKYQVAEWCEDEEDGVLIEVCRKCIKQYFERKVEEC